MARKPLSTQKKLGFGCATLLVLFGAPELGFRVREAVRAHRKPRLPVQYDPYRTLALIPGESYYRESQNRRVDVNALGFRGPEFGPKDPARPRVYCAGGSTTFGLYASSNDTTWPARLQALLAEAGQPVEAINGGAPGWTTRTNMTNLELRGFALEPDVIVVYNNWNDLISNLEDLYVARSRVEDVEELYTPEPGGPLMASAVFRFIKSRLRDPYDTLIEKQDRLSDEGCAAYERNLRRLVRRGAEQGARVFLCTFPTCLRETEAASREAGVPDLDVWYGALSPLTYPTLLEGLDRYNAIVRAVAADTEAELIDLAPTFPRDVSYYASPLHHSDTGEDEVAARVRDALLAAGVLDAARKSLSGER